MQVARPVSDLTATGWSPVPGGSLYLCLDENFADDGDYVYNLSAGTNIVELGMSPLVDPASAAGHVLRYRFELVFSGLLEDEPESAVRFSLVQGASVIATETRTFPYDSAATTYELTLSAGQANAISDYTDLRFRAEVLVGWDTAYYKVSWAEFEVPDSASGSNAYFNGSVLRNWHRAYDYPWTRVTGYDREGHFRTYSSFASPSLLMGDRPVSRDDANGGRVCSFSGLWFPKRLIVYVDGLPYGKAYAPKPAATVMESPLRFFL